MMKNSQSIEEANLLYINGLEKLAKNDFTGAEIDFELSLKIDPNRLETIINLCVVLVKGGFKFEVQL